MQGQDEMFKTPDQAVWSEKSSLLRGLLTVFCLWHFVFLIFSIIPGDRRKGGVWGATYSWYQRITGTPQEWVMFHTIPALHRMDVRFVTTDTTGQRHQTAGVILPDFRPFPDPEEARFYNIFHRMIWGPGGSESAEAYLRKVVESWHPQPGEARPESIILHIDAWHTRSLQGVRARNEIAVKRDYSFGPVLCVHPETDGGK